MEMKNFYYVPYIKDHFLPLIDSSTSCLPTNQQNIKLLHVNVIFKNLHSTPPHTHPLQPQQRPLQLKNELLSK